MAAWGASAEVIAEWRRALTQQAIADGIDIWPEHWHAWNIFLSMRTQWRAIAGFGGLLHLGLDYAALPIVLAENRSIPHRLALDELMPQLRTLEIAARDELNRE